MKRVSRKGVKFVAGWEGFRSCPYRDAVGVWTIGYGETQGVGPKTPCISERAARRKMRRRLTRDYLKPALGIVRPGLRQQEKDALASFVYNVGLGAFHDSTLLRRLNSTEGKTFIGRTHVYRSELPRWTNQGLAGLVKRRNAEVAMACYGDYSGRP